MDKDEIIRICKNAGGVELVANRLGVSRQAIYQWEEIPIKRLVEFSNITRVKRSELRPDIFIGEDNV